MIRNIKGEYLYYDKGSMIIETSGGIGFRIYVADTSPLLLHREGDIINVFTYMQVKEDGMSLYGFSKLDSLNLFEQLITVKGVGPKAGLAIMSTGSADEIKYSIANKDATAIAKAQGVGKKTAERVILELCDKVDAVPMPEMGGATPVSIPGLDKARQEAVMALTTLGYSKTEAEEAIGHVTDEGLDAETYIKKALMYLL